MHTGYTFKIGTDLSNPLVIGCGTSRAHRETLLESALALARVLFADEREDLEVERTEKENYSGTFGVWWRDREPYKDVAPAASPDTVQDRIDELFPGQPRWVCGCGRKVIGGYCWSCGYSYRQHQDRHLEDVPPVSIEAETADLDPLTITTADASLSFSGKRSGQ